MPADDQQEAAAADVAARSSKPLGRRRGFVALAAVAALAVASGGWCMYHYRTPMGGAKNASHNGGKATLGFASGREGVGVSHSPAPRIETIRAETITRGDALRLTGTLAADEKSEVGSNAAGIVSETRAERGRFVKKGDLLVQLDPRDAQYALDDGVNAMEELRVRLGLDEFKEFHVADVPEVQAAKLALELAEKNHSRAESLKPANAISQSDADQMQTDHHAAIQHHRLALLQAKQLYRSYCSAKTHLAVLRKAVEDCSICAPFDGVVVERNISVGEHVISLFPGAKLVTLVRIDPLRLSLTVPQQEIARVRAGQTVTFQTDAFPAKTFTGTVRYITPEVTSDNRSLCIEAIVRNPDAVLRPGLFVTAELQLERQRTEIRVPRAAVCNRGDVATVFVVRDGIAREQVVALGKAGQEGTEILSGLTGKELLVAQPRLVHDGDAVRR